MRRLLGFACCACAGSLLLTSCHRESGRIERVLTSMKGRQEKLEAALKSGALYEAANGMVVLNRNQDAAGAELEDLIRTENADRSSLYQSMAQAAGSGSATDIGHQRWERYSTKLITGILREDPGTGLIAQEWPAPRMPPTTQLALFFAEMDHAEADLRQISPNDLPEIPRHRGWEDASGALARMLDRLPTLVQIGKKGGVTESSDGLLTPSTGATLSFEQESDVNMENQDRRLVYSIVARQVPGNTTTAEEVGRLRSQMKKDLLP